MRRITQRLSPVPHPTRPATTADSTEGNDATHSRGERGEPAQAYGAHTHPHARGPASQNHGLLPRSSPGADRHDTSAQPQVEPFRGPLSSVGRSAPMPYSQASTNLQAMDPTSDEQHARPRTSPGAYRHDTSVSQHGPDRHGTKETDGPTKRPRADDEADLEGPVNKKPRTEIDSHSPSSNADRKSGTWGQADPYYGSDADRSEDLESSHAMSQNEEEDLDSAEQLSAGQRAHAEAAEFGLPPHLYHLAEQPPAHQEPVQPPAAPEGPGEPAEPPAAPLPNWHDLLLLDEDGMPVAGPPPDQIQILHLRAALEANLENDENFAATLIRDALREAGSHGLGDATAVELAHLFEQEVNLNHIDDGYNLLGNCAIALGRAASSNQHIMGVLDEFLIAHPTLMNLTNLLLLNHNRFEGVQPIHGMNSLVQFMPAATTIRARLDAYDAAQEDEASSTEDSSDDTVDGAGALSDEDPYGEIDLMSSSESSDGSDAGSSTEDGAIENVALVENAPYNHMLLTATAALYKDFLEEVGRLLIRYCGERFPPGAA